MNISANELSSRFEHSEIINIIDVRSGLEFHTYNIGGINIPIGNLPDIIDGLELNKNSELIVVCQHGIRSETARRILISHGFTNVKNLTGGLLAYQKLNIKY